MFELGDEFYEWAAQEHCEHVNERIICRQEFLPVTVTVAHNGTIGRSKKDGNLYHPLQTVASELVGTHMTISQEAQKFQQHHVFRF
jgi:hypothetical protein